MNQQWIFMRSLACLGILGAATFTNAQEIKLRDTLFGNTEGVGRVAFSSDGKMLASTHSDFSTRLWDLSNGKNTFVLKNVIGQPLFSQDGKTLVVQDGNAFTLYEVASGKKTAAFSKPGWVPKAF